MTGPEEQSGADPAKDRNNEKTGQRMAAGSVLGVHLERHQRLS